MAFNSLRFSDAIWRHKSWSTFVQITACYLVGVQPLQWRRIFNCTIGNFFYWNWDHNVIIFIQVNASEHICKMSAILLTTQDVDWWIDNLTAFEAQHITSSIRIRCPPNPANVRSSALGSCLWDIRWWCVVLESFLWPNNISWWRHQMETFSALLALCAGNSSVTAEFPSQRPVTRSFDVYFDLRLDKWLNKQSLGWCFETPSRSLWRQCNDIGFCPTAIPNKRLENMFLYRSTSMTRTSIIIGLCHFWAQNIKSSHTSNN